MTTASSFASFAPGVKIAPARPSEREIYERMWENPEYRKVAPGEDVINLFLSQARPNHGDTVIDFGCGTGRGALLMALLKGVHVTMLDFAENCLDDEVRDMLVTQSHALKFVRADLTKPLAVGAKYGYCTDVMEHIPPKDVDSALTNVLKAAEKVFFAISTVPDHFGQTIGHPLHLTVQPYAWWMERLREKDAVIYWSHEGNGVAMFYVSAWNNASELVSRGTVNTTDAELEKQIIANVRRGLTEVRPYDRQDTPIMILGGGPSLADFEDEIMQRRAEGMPLVTTNGAYNWAIERGMNPSAQIIVDARDFNKRFVLPHVEGCRYLLASQCHPDTFDAAPAKQTMIWHSVINEALADVLDREVGQGKWYPVPGGSTVMLRAFLLMRMLGYWKFHVYGFDSCLREDQHHAYAQTENDYTNVLRVSCGGRTFLCHPWMASQAQEFIDQVSLMGDEIDMQVHGDGLIAHIISTGASIEASTHGRDSLEHLQSR